MVRWCGFFPSWIGCKITKKKADSKVRIYPPWNWRSTWKFGFCKGNSSSNHRFWGAMLVTIPGDSSRDLFIPDRWRSRKLWVRGTWTHHPKKVTFAELPGDFFLSNFQNMKKNMKIREEGGFGFDPNFKSASKFPSFQSLPHFHPSKHLVSKQISIHSKIFLPNLPNVPIKIINKIGSNKFNQ